MLEGYNGDIRHLLVSGFRDGFRLGYEGQDVDMRSKNLKSAEENADILISKLNAEVQLGRIAGPFSQPPFPNFRVSPLGLVPKRNGSYRLIHHLSYPEGMSLNDGIPHELCSVQYATIQSAIGHILELKDNVHLCKTDIKDAFRLLPVHADEYPRLGMQVEGKYYYDRFLPMGCSRSCALFELFATALEWIVRRKLKVGVYTSHVLDDSIFIAASAAACAEGLQVFTDICAKLRIPIAIEKTMGPEQVLPFLGITLDTILMQARLPQDKLDKCQGLITAMLAKKSVRLRDLQSVLGSLNFCCSVVLPGRAFLRRLFDLTKGVAKPYHFVRLTKGTKEDLRLWLTFLENFNGKSFFHDSRFLSSDHLRLFTDASGSIGYGGLLGKYYFFGRWPVAWKALNITTLELYPIVAAIALWGPALANKNLLLMTDNASLVAVLNKQSCKEKQVMFLIRKFVLYCLKFNICCSALHVPGSHNLIADSLSRLQMDRFHRLAPWANPTPSQLPRIVLPENLGGILES